MIVVIDSGVANLRSVGNALKHLGAPYRIAETPHDLHHANKIILPGVGAFSAGMEHLRSRGFVEPLRAQVAAGTPLLGICLGMQMLFDRSEEMGDHAGLALLPGAVVRFPVQGPKVPHIGWNQLIPRRQSVLLGGINANSYAYFVHSYYAQISDTDQDTIIADSEYGINFPAVVGRGNVFGAQFHPEKSQHTGLTLLRNFIDMTAAQDQSTAATVGIAS